MSRLEAGSWAKPTYASIVAAQDLRRQLALGAPASSRPGDEVPHKTRSVHSWALPTSRLEAGAPSAIEDVGTRYASPTGRLEAGAPSAIEVVGTRYVSPTGRLEAGAPSAIEVVGTPYASPTSRLEAGAPSAISFVEKHRRAGRRLDALSFPKAGGGALSPPYGRSDASLQDFSGCTGSSVSRTNKPAASAARLVAQSIASQKERL